MKFPNQFKQSLKNKQVQYGIWLSTASSYVAEIAATSNYDWCLIDGEHAPNTTQTILTQLQAVAPYSVHPVVRVIEGTKTNIKQALDLGAQTLLVPMVDTVAQARDIVKATQYPPSGIRGVGASIARASRWDRVSNYMDNTNDDICLLIQAESKTAIDNLDGILAVKNIDGVFIGPADLSASLGYPGDPGHKDVQMVIQNAIKKIVASGKAAGILYADPTMTKRAIELGVTFAAVGVDTLLYTQALDDRLSLFKDSAKPSSTSND